MQIFKEYFLIGFLSKYQVSSIIARGGAARKHRRARLQVQNGENIDSFYESYTESLKGCAKVGLDDVQGEYVSNTLLKSGRYSVCRIFGFVIPRRLLGQPIFANKIFPEKGKKSNLF